MASEILDSDVWIAYLHTSDSQHKKATAIFTRLEDEKIVIVVPEYVLLEVVTVLRRVVDGKVAASFIRFVTGSAQVRLLKSDTALLKAVSALVYQELLPKLSFTDLALLQLAIEYKVVTFDRALQRALTKFVG